MEYDWLNHLVIRRSLSSPARLLGQTGDRGLCGGQYMTVQYNILGYTFWFSWHLSGIEFVDLLLKSEYISNLPISFTCIYSHYVCI